jgi:hypothetical protein
MNRNLSNNMRRRPKAVYTGVWKSLFISLYERYQLNLRTIERLWLSSYPFGILKTYLLSAVVFSITAVNCSR